VSARSAQPQIVFRCDASNQIGGGHAMRCLTLANALSETGAKATFVAASMLYAIKKRITDAGHEFQRIPASPEMPRPDGKWEEPPLSEDSQLADAKATGAAVGHSDWLVVDHYLLDFRWHTAARSFADHILVIDDLANRSYDGDVLLDQTFGRSAEDYRSLVTDGCRILAGSQYAILRPEFARERPAALERRKAGGRADRILVSMGTMDPEGLTARIVEEVLAVAPECAIDVVLGPQAASLARVRDTAMRHTKVLLHMNTERMAELMRDADLAIGAAGMTSWERCCLGLPSVALVLAENQRNGASTLDAAGAVIAVDRASAVAPAVGKLLGDPEQSARMSAACFAIADGSGAARVLEDIVGRENMSSHHLEVRRARKTDIEPLWLWRNDLLMRSMAKAPDAITWADHERWFNRVFDDTESELYIVELSGEPAAMVRFDRDDNRALVSINVAPQLRGRGIGKAALASTCRDFEEAHPEATLWAEVRHENMASKLAFRAAGFEQAASDIPGFATFVRRPLRGHKASKNPAL
jgi:UDP-2,4-diacetamido-2,4,6-trideoxy-beta-L-altropyranose hydrolase